MFRCVDAPLGGALGCVCRYYMQCALDATYFVTQDIDMHTNDRMAAGNSGAVLCQLKCHVLCAHHRCIVTAGSFTISTGDATNGASGSVLFTTGNSDTGNSANVEVALGTSKDVSGSDIYLKGGGTTGAGQTGGNLLFASGAGVTDGVAGSVSLLCGMSSSANGGMMLFSSSSSSGVGATAGAFNIPVGTATGSGSTGGSVIVIAGGGGAQGGSVLLATGKSTSGISGAASIVTPDVTGTGSASGEMYATIDDSAAGSMGNFNVRLGERGVVFVC